MVASSPEQGKRRSVVPTPVIAKWELSLRIRQHQEDRGLTAAFIANELGVSRPYWSRVLNDHALPAKEMLIKILDLLGVQGSERTDLTELREAALGDAWWSEYPTLVRGDLERVYGLEDGAARIRAYEASIVSGLLQTPAYAEQIVRDSPEIRSIDIARLVRIRLERQELLLANGPDITIIMSETALRQTVGNQRIMREQLDHLASLIENRSNRLEIRVLPFSAPIGGVAGAVTFFVLDFENPILPAVAWYETMRNSSISDYAEEVELLLECYKEAYSRSLDPDGSLKFLQAVATGLPDGEK